MVRAGRGVTPADTALERTTLRWWRDGWYLITASARPNWGNGRRHPILRTGPMPTGRKRNARCCCNAGQGGHRTVSNRTAARSKR